MPHPSQPIFLALAGAHRNPRDIKESGTVAVLSDRLSSSYHIVLSSEPLKKRRKIQSSETEKPCNLPHTSSRLPVDVLVAIIYQSDWQTLMAWRATSRSFFTVVATLLKRRYDAHVSPFVSNIQVFNDVLRTHRGIISGSTALHFFVPDTSWTPRTLDIYVPMETYTEFLIAVTAPSGLNWSLIRPRPSSTTADILNTELSSYSQMTSRTDIGYQTRAYTHDVEPKQEDDSESDTQLLDRHNHTTPSIVPGGGSRRMRALHTPNNRRVHLICSLSNNPITPLRFSFSSLMMNFLTPDACVCGFPSATLNRLGVLKGTRLLDGELTNFRKYRRRGFRFDSEPLRQALDMWDFVFFGERDLLALDFRLNTRGVPQTIPIKFTPRGWVPNPRFVLTQPPKTTAASDIDPAHHRNLNPHSTDPVHPIMLTTNVVRDL